MSADSSTIPVQPRQVYDSRGYPTIEVEVRLDNGAQGWEAIPSGASTGSREAAGCATAASFGGKGVKRAIANVSGEIAATVRGRDAGDQEGIDQALIALDGTETKSRLGANAILAVSLAAARAAAGARRAALALPGCARRDGALAARADGKRAERRRACRQRRRLPGVHAGACRRRVLLGGDGDGRRDLPSPARDAARARARGDGGRRGRLCSIAGVQRVGAGDADGRDRGGRLPA